MGGQSFFYVKAVCAFLQGHEEKVPLFQRRAEVIKKLVFYLTGFSSVRFLNGGNDGAIADWIACSRDL